MTQLPTDRTWGMTQLPTDRPRFYRTRQFSELVGVPIRTVQNWLKTGRLKGERHGTVGHLWYIPSSELQRLLSKK